MHDAPPLLPQPTNPPTTTTTLPLSTTSRLTKLLAFFMVGTMSWIGVTALFAQASAFQLVVPEEAKIFSYIDTFMESGNIVPALLFVFMSSERQLRAYNTTMTYALGVGALATVALLAFCWSIQIGGSSLFILLGAWGTGAVGSTCMLVLFNFAGQYGRDAVSALSVGIGACGLVTNVLGIVQGLPSLKDGGCGNRTSATPSSSAVALAPPGVGANPHGLDGKLLFGPTTFFFAVGVWLVLGCIFLHAIHRCHGWKMIEGERAEEGDYAPLPTEGNVNGNGNGNGSASTSTLTSTFTNTDQHTSVCQVGINKLIDAGKSIQKACRDNSGPMAAIFVSCFLEFAAPGLIPFQVPQGPNHAANSFWVTVFYLSGSLVGRLLTAVVSFQRFALLNALQCGTIVYMLYLAKMEVVTVPVPVSILVIGVGSAIHGYIVTEVFQLCREAGESARASAVAGLANQIGALLGSVFVFVLIKTSVIVSHRRC